MKKLKHKCLPYDTPVPEDLSRCGGGGAANTGNNGAPSTSYGAPSSTPSSSYGTPVGAPIGANNGAPSSSYGTPVGTPIRTNNGAPSSYGAPVRNPSSAPVRAPTPAFSTPSGANNIAQPPPPPVPHMNAPRVPIHSTSVIQEDSYGKPVTAPLNGKFFLNEKI